MLISSHFLVFCWPPSNCFTPRIPSSRASRQELHCFLWQQWDCLKSVWYIWYQRWERSCRVWYQLVRRQLIPLYPMSRPICHLCSIWLWRAGRRWVPTSRNQGCGRAWWCLRCCGRGRRCRWGQLKTSRRSWKKISFKMRSLSTWKLRLSRPRNLDIWTSFWQTTLHHHRNLKE